MKQKIKQFQRYVENNSIFYVVVTLLSMVFPCMMIAFFYKYNDLPLLNFFWTAFYSILGNVVLFHKKTICRIVLIIINIIPKINKNIKFCLKYMIDCIKYTVPIIPKITDILINFFNFLYDLSFFIINNIPFQQIIFSLNIISFHLKFM